MQEIMEILNFKENRLICIGGKPVSGKTMLLLKIAKEVALNSKIRAILFSLEASKEYVSKIMGDNEKEGIVANLIINDTPRISINEIKEKCYSLKKEKNIGLILIDYLQLITSNKKYSSVEQEEKAIVIELQELSKQLNIPVIITSQILM